MTQCRNKSSFSLVPAWVCQWCSVGASVRRKHRSLSLVLYSSLAQTGWSEDSWGPGAAVQEWSLTKEREKNIGTFQLLCCKKKIIFSQGTLYSQSLMNGILDTTSDYFWCDWTQTSLSVLYPLMQGFPLTSIVFTPLTVNWKWTAKVFIILPPITPNPLVKLELTQTLMSNGDSLVTVHCWHFKSESIMLYAILNLVQSRLIFFHYLPCPVSVSIITNKHI